MNGGSAGRKVGKREEGIVEMFGVVFFLNRRVVGRGGGGAQCLDRRKQQCCS